MKPDRTSGRRPRPSRPWLRLGWALSFAASGPAAWAQTAALPDPGPVPAESTPVEPRPAWQALWQATWVVQGHPGFASPYAGANSLSGSREIKETTDATLYAGVRLWSGAELQINPEVDQGYGLNQTLGLAGFPSGEAYKVGRSDPYLRMDRMFLRQVIDWGGNAQSLEAGPNQMDRSIASDHLTLTVGKFSVVDVFDTNRYAHDPRSDFLNWSVIDAGAFDYAADAWGYSYGAAAEWTCHDVTLRWGGFALSEVPNSTTLDSRFDQIEWVGELDAPLALGAPGGRARLLGFVNRGRMARYDDAVRAAQPGVAPDVANVRRFGSRAGASVNLEQPMASDWGVFARFSANDGSKEAYEFTEINRSASAGASWQGARWQRGEDSAGVALVLNGLSAAAQRYFAAGGLGILIGDGRLPHYGAEQIAEAYYSMRLSGHWKVSVDLQHVVHPAYNRDRGPVTAVAARLHAEL